MTKISKIIEEFARLEGIHIDSMRMYYERQAPAQRMRTKAAMIATIKSKKALEAAKKKR